MNIRLGIRAVSVAALTLVLTFTPYARVAAASAIQVNDPVTDTLQLWSAVAGTVSFFAQHLSAALAAHYSAINIPPNTAHASKNPKQPVAAPAGYAAAAAASALTQAVTASSNDPGAVIATERLQSRTPPMPSATGAASNPLPLAATSAFVTQTQFNAGLSGLSNSLQQLISESATNPVVSGYGAPLSAEAFAPSQQIGQLSNVTITNANLTASEIPALDYLSLSGGTLSGPLIVPTLNASSTVFSSFSATNATTTNLAVNGTAYFVGNVSIGTTSTSALFTIDSPSTSGSIFRLSNASSGGHTFDLVSTGSSNTGGAGRFDIFDRTLGLARLSIAVNGNVGVGTTSPFTNFAVVGNGYFSGSLSVGDATTTRSNLGLLFATSGDFIPGIAAWGDSLTQGGSDNYIDELSVLTGISIYNGGIVGQNSAQISARMLAASDKYSWPVIIWTGRNNISGDISNDEPNILPYVASMVAALTNNNYIILSIPNANTEPSGSANYAEIIQINNDLAAIYGSHFLDERAYLIQNGLSVAGISPTAQDLVDIGNDVPPSSLRTDFEHPNAAGDLVIAKFINQNISLLIPSSSSSPILTSKNFLSYLSLHAPTFPLLNTRDGYAQDDQTILYTSIANNNTFVGVGAGALLPTTTFSLPASYNTAVGYQALMTATSSSGNSAFGRWALKADTTGNSNTGLGHAALAGNTTGNSNTAVGSNAMLSNTTGGSNTAVGTVALFVNTTGASNNAFGVNALVTNKTGGSNAAFGNSALSTNITGSQNVAIGHTAAQNNSSATNTVAVGYQAAVGIGGAYNNQGVTVVGSQAGFNFQTGSDFNTLLGYRAGNNVTTGASNVLIGANINAPSTTLSAQLNIANTLYGQGIYSGAGLSSTPVSTGKIAIGTTTPYARLTVWGPDSAASTTAFMVANNASTTEFAVLDNGNATLAGNLIQNSDQRLKTNIQTLDASSSLAAINALHPMSYSWIDPDKGGVPQFGFIAQDVQRVFPNLVSVTSPTPLTPDGTLSLNYNGFIAPLVSAVQSLIGSVSDLADHFTTKELTFTRATGDDIVTNHVHTQELCIGTTCVTEDQLQTLLRNSGVSGSSVPQQNNSPQPDASSSDNGSAGTTTVPDAPPLVPDDAATSTDQLSSSDTANSTTTTTQ